MKRIFSSLLLLGLVFQLGANPAFAHTSNQYWDSATNMWVDNRCSDGSTTTHFQVNLWTNYNLTGTGLAVCAFVDDLTDWSVGDTSDHWNNKTSSLQVVWKDSGTCLKFFQYANYNGGLWIWNGFTVNDLRDYGTDNWISSLKKLIPNNQTTFCTPG